MKYVEEIILRNLQYDEDYARKVMPYIKEEYFSSISEREYFKTIKKYFENFNSLPSKDAIDIEFQDLKVTEEVFKELTSLSVDMAKAPEKKESYDWLVSKTEEFCKDRALYNALNEAISISQSEEEGYEKLSKTSIPELLSNALAVSFDTNIGHDYTENTDERFEYYHQKTYKISTHLDMINKITQGRPERKTVNCIAAGTGIGKSMLLCDLAAGHAKNGYNVLYITNEMAEEKISQRIDANLMNVDIQKVDKMDKESWDKGVQRIKEMCVGKIVVKEYPTSTAHVGHYRFLLKELKQKQNFTPDIIIIDYLNICASARYNDKSNSYGYIKSICEEIRGLAVETNTLIWTATQLNRDGIDNADVDLKNISESMGGPMTFDFLIALISNEELASMNQVMVKQLKNRYGDLFINNKFTIGVDRAKMKFFDLQNSGTSRSVSPQSNNSFKLGSTANTQPSKNPPKTNKFSGIKT